MKGQGLIEYAAILIIILVAVIAIVVLIGPTMGNLFSNKVSPCVYEQSFACKNTRVEACLESEAYTREECIALIGGSSGK